MVDTWIIGTIVLGFSFGGVVAGCLLQGVLPKSQLSTETRDVLKLVIGLIGTLSALVLGLMIGSARNSYDRQRQQIIEQAAKMIALDRMLVLYGPESHPLREEFRVLISAAADRIWPTDRSRSGRIDPSRTAEAWYHRLQQLSPSTEDQRFYHGRAVSLGEELLHGRWLLYQQSSDTISVPFVIVIIFWFCLIFACIGILAPRNPTVLVALFLCAVSVAGAMVLAFELDRPFSGFMRMSSEPIQKVLMQLGQE